jgi:hypothetical protein
MVYTLTSKHLKVYSDEAMRLAKVFGLTDWEIAFRLMEAKGEFLACCAADNSGRVAVLGLATEWIDDKPTIIKLKDAAMHEVYELLLWDVTQLITERYLKEDDINKTRHALIRRLESATNGRI